MPTNRALLRRSLRRLDDYRICEAMTLKRALISAGFEGDEAAIAAAWAAHEELLIHLWIDGWTPTAAKFITKFEPGRPATRPPGWWRFRAPGPRRVGESVIAYLDRTGKWLPGERASCVRGTP
jgi:hypothetical protein